MFDDKIEYSSNFFKLGINHGQSVDNDAYEYVMLPNSSETQIKDYAKTIHLKSLRIQI